MGHSTKMKPKVIYIAGEGRSGSTLLEIYYVIAIIL